MNDLHTLGKAMRDAQRAYLKNNTVENFNAEVAAEAAFDKALAAPPAKMDRIALGQKIREAEYADVPGPKARPIWADGFLPSEREKALRMADAAIAYFASLAAPPAKPAALDAITSLNALQDAVLHGEEAAVVGGLFNRHRAALEAATRHRDEAREALNSAHTALHAYGCIDTALDAIRKGIVAAAPPKEPAP